MADKRITFIAPPGLHKRAEDKQQLQEPDELSENWRDFCDATTIHGLRYIGGNNPPPIGYRIIWGVIWVIMFVLCIWLCTNSIQQYMLFDVDTATTFQVVKAIDYPAFTICNENLYKRSVVGSSMEFMRVMMRLTNGSITDDKELEELALENQEECHSDNRSAFGIELDERKDAYWYEKGFVQGLRPAVMDSYSMVEKVWWDDVEYPVDGSFLNHALDHTVCFTYNAGEMYVRSMVNSTGQIPETFGYGLNVSWNPKKNISEYKEKKLLNAGQYNGFRVLLNTKQEEYCGMGRRWNGAGAKVIIHEPNNQPWFLLQPALSFAPGFDITVVIKPTMFFRKTDFLDRCVNDVYLYMMPYIKKDSKNYYKGLCYQQCFLEQAHQKCDCYPAGAYHWQDRYNDGVFNGITGKKINLTDFCWGEKMKCLSDAEDYYLQHNPDQACTLCREPCFETKYDFEISNMLFPSQHLIPYYTKELNLPDKDMLYDNLILLSFVYEGMIMRNIDEVQAFGLLDLFTYFGGILGLFLGMSIMSIAEVVHQARISAEEYFTKRRQQQNMNSNLSTIITKGGPYSKQKNLF